MNIAGRAVKLNDNLWHAGHRRWVTVAQAEPCLVEMLGTNSQKVTYAVAQGGHIAGVRQLYWHQPLELDVPQSDISGYQTLVDTLKQVITK